MGIPIKYVKAEIKNYPEIAEGNKSKSSVKFKVVQTSL